MTVFWAAQVTVERQSEKKTFFCILNLHMNKNRLKMYKIKGRENFNKLNNKINDYRKCIEHKNLLSATTHCFLLLLFRNRLEYYREDSRRRLKGLKKKGYVSSKRNQSANGIIRYDSKKSAILPLKTELIRCRICNKCHFN